MKTLGLIGGISWISTVDYYKLINEGINSKLGGLNFSQCVIYSFNYADIKKNNDANDWDSTLQMITTASEHLKTAGAKAIILCANTMHLIAEKLEQNIGVPVIHIATATAATISSQKIKKVGLLGTKFTMELDFFKAKLAQQSIETIIPGNDDRDFLHYTIFEELGRGILSNQTKQRYLSIIEQLIEQGAEGIILGCTEIPLLIQPGDVGVPVFDTTRIHAAAAIEFALS
jgi:aspartate racemase